MAIAILGTVTALGIANAQVGGIGIRQEVHIERNEKVLARGAIVSEVFPAGFIFKAHSSWGISSVHWEVRVNDETEFINTEGKPTAFASVRNGAMVNFSGVVYRGMPAKPDARVVVDADVVRIIVDGAISPTVPPLPSPTPPAAGQFNVSIAPSSPAYRALAAGTANAEFLALTLSAGSEPLQVEQLAFWVTGSRSFDRMHVWDGAIKVGEVVPTSDDRAMLVRISGLAIPQNGSKIVTIKGDITAAGSAAFKAGNLVAVNWDNTPALNYAVGQSSSRRAHAAGMATDAPGARIFKSVPVITVLPVPTNTLQNGDRHLYRFSITAGPQGGISLYKFTFDFDIFGDEGTADDIMVTEPRIYAYADSSYSNPAFVGGGRLNFGPLVSNGPVGQQVELYFNPNILDDAEAIVIPAGTTRYFELRANVAGADAGDRIGVALEGDAGWTALGPISSVDASAENDFLWSGNSAGTSGLDADDWANGYGVPGLPAGGASSVTLAEANVPATRATASFFSGFFSWIENILKL
ncbi:hypothetical protein C4552_02480 [Candidatus Parcubacteria bacterium]|nr:MAG: hypothetical protein C4552_02480 [Candidatus Parcubacteria bacterium]